MHNMNPGTILLTLIQGEDGKQWASNKKGWTSFTVEPVCSWEGILCDEEAGVIVEAIFLPKSGLPGTISSELGMLTSLKGITIPEGKLRGTIPELVAKLPNLEVVNLSQNQLTGTIPNFESRNLRSLDLGYNRFTGTLLPELCSNKNKMTDFDIINNKISGQIPSCFSSMGNLVTLSLSENRLSGTLPASLGELVVLEYLYLDNNFLMGMIPPAIARVDSALREFWLQENLLSGTIPASVADIANLKDFYVDGNKFTGTVPSDLCRSEINADFFENVDPNIKRDFCQSIACPVNTVSMEGVYPCVPCKIKYYNPYLGRTGACTTLNQREILHNLYQSANGGTWIGASNWAIEDTFICDFTGITCDANNHIVAIDLKGRGLTGTIPASIGYLKYLSKLDLSDNDLTGFLPSDLRWAPLETLDVSGNSLRGIVPSTLCLKTFVNGNGAGGEYSCNKVACPVGYFSTIGYENDEVRCIQCLDDSAKFLGLKTCHKYSHHHMYGVGPSFGALLVIFFMLGGMMFALVRIVGVKDHSSKHEFEIVSKGEQEPSLSNKSSNEESDDANGFSEIRPSFKDVPDDLSLHSQSLRSLSPPKVTDNIDRNRRGSTIKNTTTDWLDVPDI